MTKYWLIVPFKKRYVDRVFARYFEQIYLHDCKKFQNIVIVYSSSFALLYEFLKDQSYKNSMWPVSTKFRFFFTLVQVFLYEDYI